MSPNAMRVLRALGLEDGLRRTAFQTPAWVHRVWDSGEYLGELAFRDAETRYGAPYPPLRTAATCTRRSSPPCRPS